MSARVLILNGPNLNLLGIREKDIYGRSSLGDIEADLNQMAGDLDLDLQFFQSNHEGALIDRIHMARQEKIDFMIINAGALTHYSYALHDALKAVDIPVIEVHMSNIYQREDFRHHSVISPAVVGGIFGLGSGSYRLALYAVEEMIRGQQKSRE